MTAKGLWKCRAVDSEENLTQVSHRRPQALGNGCATWKLSSEQFSFFVAFV
jgi:hypothetical protein